MGEIGEMGEMGEIAAPLALGTQEGCLLGQVRDGACHQVASAGAGGGAGGAWSALSPTEFLFV